MGKYIFKMGKSFDLTYKYIFVVWHSEGYYNIRVFHHNIFNRKVSSRTYNAHMDIPETDIKEQILERYKGFLLTENNYYIVHKYL